MAISAKNTVIKLIQGKFQGDDPRVQTLQAVLNASRDNNAVLDIQDMGIRNGKLRQVQVYWLPVDCEDDATCPVDLCDTDPATLESEIFTLGKCTAVKGVSVGFNDIRDVDGEFTFSDYTRMILANMMETMRSKLSNSLRSELAAIANTSVFVDGSGSKRINLLNQYGGLDANGYFEIETALQDAGLENPYVVGASKELNFWNKNLALANTNFNGVNLQGLPKGNVYYDARVNNAFADPSVDHVIAFAKNSIKFVSYAENVGQFANILPNEIEDLTRLFQQRGDNWYGVVIDPMTQLMYDVNIVFDGCSKTWHITMYLKWDLFLLPTGRCNDEEDVTGVFHFTVCKDVLQPCPVPAQTATYSAIVADTFPVAGASGLTRNGVTHTIVSPASLTELVATMNEVFPDTHFEVNTTNKIISYQGTAGQTIVLEATADVTMTFTA